jgi:hypothetical protein
MSIRENFWDAREMRKLDDDSLPFIGQVLFVFSLSAKRTGKMHL